MNRMVREVLSRDFATCHLDTSFLFAARLVEANDKRFVTVLDEEGNACGVITEQILLRSHQGEIDQKTAEDIMATPVLQVSADALMSEAEAIMQIRKVQHLVVVHAAPLQAQRPIGLISAVDVIREWLIEE